jgi:solute:Na+ symporter, SSS family
VLIFGAFLTAVLVLGFRAARARRPGLDDYLLAGRALTVPSFVATLVPTFFGGVLGVGEFTYRYGISNWLIQGAPYYVFGLLYALFLAKRVRAAPGRTLPDHLEESFGKPVAVLACVWIALLATPADELLMLGSIVQWATGWPLAAGVILAAFIGLSFLALGGLRSDVAANRLQIAVMYCGFFVILPFAWKGLPELKAALPPAHLTLLGGNSLSYAVSWFFIALWTFVDPAFHQRVCAANDGRTASVGIAVSVLFWFAFDLMTTTAGLCARAALPDLANPLFAYPELSRLVLPPVLRGVFLAGMSASVIAALSAASFVSATTLAKDAAGRLWNAPPDRQESWVRFGLLATAAYSIVLALALPSVVGLWYAVGSCAVPGLLVITLACYFPALRPGRKTAFACSLLGGGVSLAWLAAGSPRGLEPFYPGLAASVLAWGAGKTLE